uniref:SFRICE_008387 n=1 Tax=Spodoptera frugiperda TaxID=7108 RepID=A0A2H1VI48_SPOFR
MGMSNVLKQHFRQDAGKSAVKSLHSQLPRAPIVLETYRAFTDRLSASSTLTHPWLIQSALCTELHVTKSKLKRYVIKKRWAKAVSAVIALKRMGAKFEDHHDEKIEEKNGEN